MFTKGLVLIFLILGLSSSIAHAVPHQNRANDNSNPCLDTSPAKNSTDGKTADKSLPQKQKVNTAAAVGKANATNTGDNNGNKSKGANGANGKNDTSVNNSNNDKNKSATDNGNNDLTLDPSLINLASKSDGLNNATNGTTASLTSNNNFLDFCKGKTLTNGQQIKTGSCNPIPMGDIPSTDNIPTFKFVTPENLSTLKANTPFTVKVAFKNMVLGKFTNAETTYYAAPLQVDKNGKPIGHTHVVIEAVGSLQSTTPTNALGFTFFKGINDPPGPDGTVSADVAKGLPNGVYRVGTISSGPNHGTLQAAVAQRGMIEDVIYITVTDDGKAGTGSTTDTGNNQNTTDTAKGNGNKGNKTTTGGNDKNTTAGDATGAAKGNKGDKTATGNNKNNTTSGDTGNNGNKNTTGTATGNTNTTDTGTNKTASTTSKGNNGKKTSKLLAAEVSPVPSPSQSPAPNKFSLSYGKD